MVGAIVYTGVEESDTGNQWREQTFNTCLTNSAVVSGVSLYSSQVLRVKAAAASSNITPAWARRRLVRTVKAASPSVCRF